MEMNKEFKISKCSINKNFACYHGQHNNACQVIHFSAEAKYLIDNLYIKYLKDYRDKEYYDFIGEMIKGLEDIQSKYNKE